MPDPGRALPLARDPQSTAVVTWGSRSRTWQTRSTVFSDRLNATSGLVSPVAVAVLFRNRFEPPLQLLKERVVSGLHRTADFFGRRLVVFVSITL